MNVYLIAAGIAVFFAAGVLVALSLALAARRGDEALEDARSRSTVQGVADALRELDAVADALWMPEPPRVHRRAGGGWIV